MNELEVLQVRMAALEKTVKLLMDERNRKLERKWKVQRQTEATERYLDKIGAELLDPNT